jgi:glutamate dehydrogenase (NADP+)
MLTGKGLAFGGSLIRKEATGYGCVYFVNEMLKTKNDSLKGKTCTVSGSGNVAQFTAEKILHLGGKVVTLSDSKGFIYDPSGITQEKLDWVKNLKTVRHGRIEEYAKEFGCEFFPNERPWRIACDAAFPSATQNELDENDANTLVKNGCLAIGEGANMPSTPEAVKVFIDSKILYGPGKAANAGGVAVSGLEMSQNSMGYHWTHEELEKKLQDIMVKIHNQCVQHGQEESGFINYVNGSNIAGFIKVADAMLAFGIL